MTISRILYRPHLPREDRNIKVCMRGEVPDVITAIPFVVDRFRGFRSPGV